MTKDPHPEITNAAWLDEVTAALGVPRDDVDVQAILRLASDVSAQVARPMVPVSAFLLGLAAGRGDEDLATLLARLETTFPGAGASEQNRPASDDESVTTRP